MGLGLGLGLGVVWVGELNTCQPRTFGIEIVHYNTMQFNARIAGLEADHSGLHPIP
jgi:hypothetical protein